MNDAPKTVAENELHAYADNQLPPDEAARVEAWLAEHPDDAARVDSWRDQNQAIRGMFAGYHRLQPGDRERVTAKSRRTPLRRMALQAASIFIVFGIGYAAGNVGSHAGYNPNHEPPLFRQANDAFLIYSSEVRHPVEVRADERDHLVAWLGKRLGHKLTAPDLSATGFGLVGGRLVPVDGEAGALLMYEDAAGKRLTILLGRSPAERETAFRFASAGNVETFWWIDASLSYAVTGEISRDRLRQVADECYKQFEAVT